MAGQSKRKSMMKMLEKAMNRKKGIDNLKSSRVRSHQMRTIKIFLSTIIIVMVTSLEAVGAANDYDNEAEFIAAAPFPLSMESFEGLFADNAQSLPSLTLPDFTIVGDPGKSTLGVWNYTPSWGGHATDGEQYVLAGSTTYELDFYLNYDVKAFGLNIIDWGDWGSGTLTFSNHNDALFTIAVSPLPNENELFFGAISTEKFNHVTLSHNISGEAYMIDEVYYGIPEPCTVLLLGLGGLALVRKRRTVNHRKTKEK